MRLTPRGLLFGGRRFPVALGKGGITRDKREGDGATPAGLHHILACYYRADRVARPAPWAIPIGPRDLWSDAPDDPAYNTHVTAPYDPSHERLRRADPLYDIVLTTSWNTPATPGRGSAIFLHRWRKRGHPTEGCLAFAPADIARIAALAPPGTALLVPPGLAADQPGSSPSASSASSIGAS
ncbi:L,D-transpeptidase [Oceanicola sp. 502str15]|uniref:L,D-transpeptidase family protein n=1 Tax=Oceanicola sp. 502str15 TaxID=2696061 RepID=UPI00209446A3|nr:L,D-transpeptidase family protein [Oceanicola sp. 502str15]MCO6384519.1 L,D-transpeptidase family protein [Oceanicola sp. 502str15]